MQGSFRNLPLNTLVLQPLIFEHGPVALQNNRPVPANNHYPLHLIRQIYQAGLQPDEFSVIGYCKKPFHSTKY